MKKLILVLLLAAPVSYISMAQQTITIPDKVKKIEVTGSAEMEVVPDEIYISITLQEYYNNKNGKAGIDEISKSFLVKCEEAGITKDRIEIQNMSGFDQTPWWQKKKKKTQPDLLQSTAYVIKFISPAEVDKLVNVLDDNATQNVYVNKTSNSKETEYRKQLKVQALQNAKAKAQYMLEGIGEKPGEVLLVKEIEANAGPVYRMAYAEMAMSNTAANSGSSANEGINFKKIKYRFEVEAHFAIQ
ncbi:MAG TPA: SIMPL domain-containing protein [Bacteroidia bacterium]|nr:SIMPL domain-containing protein [Bacteroidia bacterium]